MTFDKLLIHNFGIYKGRQTVVLSPPTPEQPIVLFGGLNGAGKTTFVDALQLVLYGKTARCSNRGTLAYDEFLRRSIHEGVDPSEGAAIALRFRQVSEGEEHEFQIQRSWFASASSVRETVEVLKNGRFDRVLTETWNEHVETVLPVRLSNLFFFDAEKIEGFAEVENSAKLLSTAIYSLLGLELVERLSADLTVFERRRRVALRNQADRERIDALKTELESLERRRDALVLKHGEARNEFDRRKRRFEEVSERFRSEGGELLDRRAEFEARRKFVEDRLAEIEAELLETAAGSAPLLLVPDLLGAVVEQDRLESDAEQADALARFIADRDARILESLSGQKIPKTVFSLLATAFETERQRLAGGAVTPFLHLSAETRDDLWSLMNSVLPDIRRRLGSRLAAADDARSESVDLERKLAGVPDAESLEKLRLECRELRESVDEARIRVETVADELAAVRRDVSRQKSKLSAELEKTVEIELEHEDVNRILLHSRKIKEKLETFRAAFVRSRIRQIEELILDSFQKLLRKQTLVSGLAVNPETFSLTLHGLDGRTISPERLSAGERQLLAVSMLWGLGRASGRPLPTVIDTPLGRLDPSHRTHLVERYFPFAGHQVLLFLTDKEIDQAYFETLKPHVGRFYRLEYDDSSRATHISENDE